ncbi:MAG: alpha/beta hydrolase [Chloroflexi bacterium]|nr:alpha/beta hydrolase [Chloroflexota bacterium]
MPGNYASVNGLNLYYETHGSGQPLILLHGGVLPMDVRDDNLADLTKHRQVIAVHMQGHGHTPDIDRPLRTESMADDIAALITQLDLAPVDLVGYSMGGAVALQTAIRHPAQIRKLVVISAAMGLDGWYPEVQNGFVEMKTNAAQLAGSLKQSPYSAQYPEVDWQQLFTKLGTLTSSPYDWSDQIASITAPTMLVFADADSIRPEHIVEMYRRLGGGQRDPGLDGSLRPTTHLAIVPGTTHYNLVSTPQVAQQVAQFLEAPMPAAG